MTAQPRGCAFFSFIIQKFDRIKQKNKLKTTQSGIIEKYNKKL